MASQQPKRKNRTLLYVLIGVFLLLIVAAAIKARQKPKGEEVTVEKVQKRTIKDSGDWYAEVTRTNQIHD